MKMLFTVLCIGLLGAGLSGFAYGQDENILPQYPHVVLSNGVLEVPVFLTDPEKGFYRSSRYDWGGMIWQITYQGHTYFMKRKSQLPHDPENTGHGIGLCEEFDSTGRTRYPQRFDEAKPGETFIKIGVGSLEKPEGGKPYSYGFKYRVVNPGKRTQRHGKNWIEYTQTLKDAYGFGYVYTKRIELAKGKPELVLSHSLKNTGKKTIIADQYCHNFYCIDRENAGKSYRVDLFFPAKFAKDVGPTAVIRDNKIIFEQDVERGFMSYMEGYTSDVAHNHAVIHNLKTGASVDISGDFPLRGFNFYSDLYSVCAEFFVDINVEPGKTQKWTRSYRFFVE